MTSAVALIDRTPDLLGPYVVLRQGKFQNYGCRLINPPVQLALVAMEHTPSTILMHKGYGRNNVPGPKLCSLHVPVWKWTLVSSDFSGRQNKKLHWQRIRHVDDFESNRILIRSLGRKTVYSEFSLVIYHYCCHTIMLHLDRDVSSENQSLTRR